MARKAPRRGLATWLIDSRTPLFVLDARRMVLVFNRGCEELTGWSAGEVVGNVCDFVTETDREQVESLTGCLCPPAEVTGGESRSVDAVLLCRDGRTLDRTVHFLPLVADDESKFRILGVITETTEHRPPPTASLAPELHRLLAENRTRLHARYGTESLIATGPAMRRVLEQVRLAREHPFAVHIHGERGSGKEHVGRVIHFGSARRLSAFVPVDCAALPAFDVKRTVRRLLEAGCDGDHAEFRIPPGSLLLKQVGDLARDVQQILVEAFSGASQRVPEVRLLSTETRPLDRLLDEELLLPEFYYLITSLAIDVPPLRERGDDLPLLAQQFLEEWNRDQDRQVTGFAPEVLQTLCRYNWPGNVAELRSVVAAAREAARGSTVLAGDLPYWFHSGTDAQTLAPTALQPRPLAEHLAEVEADQIRWALRASKQNKSLAAELLGLTRAKLYRRMDTLGITDDA